MKGDFVENMKSLSRLLALVLTVILTVPLFPVQSFAASATTVTVGASGCDFTSINDALSKYSSDVVINVKAGTYYEQLKITGSNVTINCEDGVLLSGEKYNVYYLDGNYYDSNRQDANGNNVKCNPDMVRITGTNVTLNGMEIAYFSSSDKKVAPTGIRVKGNASHITIADCKVHDIACVDEKGYNAHGITVKGHGADMLTDITVTGCEVYNLTLGSSEAVVFNGNVTTVECSNNYIHDCNNIGIDFAGYYQGTGAASDRVNDVECFGNVVVNCSASRNAAYGYGLGCNGIYVDGGCNIRIHDNYIKSCDVGIGVSSEIQGAFVNGVCVQNNIVTESNLYGISIGGCKSDRNGFAYDCQINSNTVYSTGTVPCFRVQNASASSNQVYDNVFISANDRFVSYGTGYEASKIVIKDNVDIKEATVVSDETNRTITIDTEVAVGNRGAHGTIVVGQDVIEEIPVEDVEAPAVQQPYATITVDQHRSDWNDIPVANSEFTQYVSGAKIEYVKVCYDDTYNYLMFNANSFGDGYQIYINSDNDDSTGYEGYDYLIENDRLYVSTGTGWNWQRLELAEADFTLSRRESSRHFAEVRFNRATMNMSTSYSYSVVLLDSTFHITYEVSGDVY